jgi:outer membrane receptor protein involved in Fe transport
MLFKSRLSQQLSIAPLKTAIASASLVLILCNNAFANPTIEEVFVSSDFRNSEINTLSNSVTVFNETLIKQTGAQHLETLLGRAPNVNYSSGASRGRFFQIRGVGERSQFVNPVNPSIGLIIDGIDFTGLGLSASTLDIQQIEILRGPQGTLYGTNALGGLINFKSNAPSEAYSGSLSAQLSDYDGRSLDAVVSGPISNNTGYRVAGRINRQDGYIENTFLNRDDTNNIDEALLKVAVHSDINEQLSIKLNVFFAEIDNGYDAFSLNSTRETTSDQPGKDTQDTLAASLTVLWNTDYSFDVEAILSHADTDTLYSFDEDWSHLGEFDAGTFPYSSADRYERDRNNQSIDIRLVSKADQKILNGRADWVLGIYQRSEEETLKQSKSKDLLPNPGKTFSNEYETDNYALYGQLTTSLSDQWSLITGLRIEQRDADYNDSRGINGSRSDTYFGGRLALEYQLNDDSLLYGLISRGYKGDGVNAQIIAAEETNDSIPESIFFFDAETLINYEIGAKTRLLDNTLQIQVAAFYQDRKNAQIKQSIFESSNQSFDDYLDNTKADSLGIELEALYLATEQLSLYASVGFLEAELVDFLSLSHVDARTLDDGSSISLDGRDIAHAPNYQFTLGAEYQLTSQLSLGLDVEGKDEFYFSNTHNEKSESYELLHANLSYVADQWTVSLWGRNLTDEDVETRGFYFSNEFGNNPGNGYAPETYTQFGEPRLVGISASYEW